VHYSAAELHIANKDDAVPQLEPENFDSIPVLVSCCL